VVIPIYSMIGVKALAAKCQGFSHSNNHVFSAACKLSCMFYMHCAGTIFLRRTSPQDEQVRKTNKFARQTSSQDEQVRKTNKFARRTSSQDEQVRKTNKFARRTSSSVKNHTVIAIKSPKEEDVPI